MLKGIVFALTACLIWGLIFVVPLYMEGYTSLEVAMGRYVVYSLISLCIFLKKSFKLPLAIWIKGLSFSFFSTFGYYLLLILGIRDASAQMAALIVGLAPITISFYGNLKKRETGFRYLLLPAILIIAGLLTINLPQLNQTEEPANYLIGIAASFGSLIVWTWYVVANADFLKTNRDVASSDWSTIIGTTSLFWVILIGGMATLSFPEYFNIQKFISSDTELFNFISGSLILGVLCSWLGAYLWNRASLYLPVSFAGQLTLFETIFGILYVYLLSQSLPPLSEVIGLALFFIAILYAIRHSLQPTLRKVDHAI